MYVDNYFPCYFKLSKVLLVSEKNYKGGIMENMFKVPRMGWPIILDLSHLQIIEHLKNFQTI